MNKCDRCGEPVARGEGFKSWTENNPGKFYPWFLCQACQRKLYYFLEKLEGVENDGSIMP